MLQQKYQLVLTRHGQSIWNQQNLFTGWVNVGLTEKGIQEAITAGQKLKEAGFEFDLAYTSVLTRAIQTLNLILTAMDLDWIQVKKDWRLNERHYGALQGLNKKKTAEKYGKDQVHLWRRSYATLPPLLEENSDQNPKNDIRYQFANPAELPLAESLKKTIKRVIPFWKVEILPQILANKKIIISAHGNSLRALIKHLENIPDTEIDKLEIPTGKPLIYTLNEKIEVVEKKFLE